jgi:hypothetical protein
MRPHRIAASAAAAALTLTGFLTLAPAAQAGSSVTEPSDCSLTSGVVWSTVSYHMTCTARPPGQQWQIVVWCNPRGQEGADYFYYGNIVTGNGTSSGPCTFNSEAGYAAISFSDSDLQPPGRQPS